jgi:hypothetical protein
LTIDPTYVLVLFVTDPADIDDLAMLARFAQLAMARAEAASARAEAVEAEGGDPSAHLAAFDRMGRAMRLALSLRRRFTGEAETQTATRVRARKEQLKAALTPAIYAHAAVGERLELQWALDQRLETEADAFADLPLHVGLERLRKTLGLPAFVHTDLGDAAACNPLTAFGGARPVGEQLSSAPVPPPGRSPVEGEVARPAGPRRRELQPTATAAADSLHATGPP